MRLGFRPPAALAAFLALAACEPFAGSTPPPPAPERRASVYVPVQLEPEVAAVYRERGHRPFWVKAAGLTADGEVLLRRLATAQADGFDPGRYGVDEIEALLQAGAAGDRGVAARVELLLTKGFALYVRDLNASPNSMRYIDEELEPQVPEPAALLAGGRPADALRLTPLYESLRTGVVKWRAKHRPSAKEEAIVRANLERTRAIPERARRYLIVDAGSARLWMVDGRKVEGPMRVIVGNPTMQTPELAGLIRYVALNPYWNLPPDLARQRARRVLKEGPGFLARERIEILSDWGDKPRVLKPSQVDWRAVASGKIALRMRQLPGGGNVMGAMKFMLPNDLGIYLHDFPDKSLFARADRRLSSGCVRVEDAPRLARWLFGGTAPRPKGNAPEQHVDLPTPVPVYMTYLTALPDPERGLAFQRDGYARDRTALAKREAPRRGG